MRRHLRYYLDRMPFGAGERLGPYEIHGPIGAGGMGEVYQARDTRLGRDVAIKVLTAEFSERFEREARAIAALPLVVSILSERPPSPMNNSRSAGDRRSGGHSTV